MPSFGLIKYIMEKIKRKEQVNLLNMPDEILLEIFKYAMQHIGDYKILGQVCTRFHEVVKCSALYTSLVITPYIPYIDVMYILTRYHNSIKTLSMSNIYNKEKSRTVFAEIKKMKNLVVFKLKKTAMDRYCFECLKTMVEQCNNLKSFTVIGSRDGIPDNEWSGIIEILSSRKMTKLCIEKYGPPLRNLSSLIENNVETLISFEVVVPEGVSFESAVSRCVKLKNLRLEAHHDEINGCRIKDLYPLENLLGFSIEYPVGDFQELRTFFSRPCCFQLRFINILCKFSDYVSVLETIVENCPNLESIRFSPRLKSYESCGIISKHIMLIVELLHSCKNLDLNNVSLFGYYLMDIFKHDRKKSVIRFKNCSFGIKIKVGRRGNDYSRLYVVRCKDNKPRIKIVMAT